MTDRVMTLIADLKFAKTQHGEFSGLTQLLRYVAAINPEATREQFLAACVAEGYDRGTASKQFKQSRDFDLEAGDFIQNDDGSLTEVVKG